MRVCLISALQFVWDSLYRCFYWLCCCKVEDDPDPDPDPDPEPII
jgi:hypothetical protein